MIEKEKGSKMTVRFCKSLLLGTVALAAIAAPAHAQSATKTKELHRYIEQQQKMIEGQAKTLESLKTQVEALQNASMRNKVAVGVASNKIDEALTKAKPKKAVTSGKETVKLAISGQVNRAVLIADDSLNTEIYHVDNDHSSTRVRFVGEAKPSGDLTAGARIEVQFESNSSAAINQNNENSATGTNSFTERELEIYAKHKRFGNLWLGQGDTATNETAEADLSGTGLIIDSEVDVMAGSMLFRNSDTNALSSVKISSVFDHLDGLSRDDRIRYDSPKFMGFVASASHAQGGANDYAVRYSGKWGEYKAKAALGYANLSSSSSTNDRLDGSWSVLHEPTGLSLTMAGGRDDFKASGRANAVFWYGKLGWQKKLFTFGKTYTGIDYAMAKNEGQNDDRFKSIGLGIVQKLDEWGTEFYAGYRWHRGDRSSLNLDDINTAMMGARVKF